MERLSKNQNNSQQCSVPVKETSTNFIREHLHPTFVGNKFTKHGQQGEVGAKVLLNTNGHQIQEKGLRFTT
jgi:hypothetical protein